MQSIHFKYPCVWTCVAFSPKLITKEIQIGQIWMYQCKSLRDGMMQSFMQLSPDSVNVGRRQIESKNAIVKYMGDQLSQLGWLGDIWAFDKHSSRQNYWKLSTWLLWCLHRAVKMQHSDLRATKSWCLLEGSCHQFGHWACSTCSLWGFCRKDAPWQTNMTMENQPF